MSTRAMIEFWDERAWRLQGTPLGDGPDGWLGAKLFLHGNGGYGDIIDDLKKLRDIHRRWKIVPAAGYAAANYVFLYKLYHLKFDMENVKTDGITPFDMLEKANPEVFDSFTRRPDSLGDGIGEIWILHPDEPFARPMLYLYKVILPEEDWNWYVIVHRRGNGEVVRGYLDDHIKFREKLYKSDKSLCDFIDEAKELPIVLSNFS